MSENIEFHVAGAWIAVYLDGKLQRVGDSYLADEWLQSHFNVKVVYDDAFMRGGDHRDTVANTLDEVRDYALERDQLLSRATELHEQAAELEAKAKALVKEAACQLPARGCTGEVHP
jgi:hypothetical protein